MRLSRRTALVAIVLGTQILGCGVAHSQEALAAAPEPVQKTLVGFGAAYETILNRSLRVEAQKIEVEKSRESRLLSLGAFTPSLRLDVSQERSGDPVIGPRYSGALTANLNLFKAGGDLSSYRAAGQDVRSRREQLLSEIQTAEEEAIQALITVIARAQQKKIIEQIVEAKAESLRIARERFQRGHLPLQEVDKVSIELENSRARLTDAETSETEARAQLKALLGHEAVSVIWPWKEALVSGSPLEESTFELSERPDWRSQQANVEAARFRQTAAWSGLFPRLDLSASYGNFDLSEPERRDWSASLLLTIPLFERFSNWTSVQQRSLEEQSTRVRLESLRREVPAEVESLRRSHKAARTSALARERTAKLTQKLFSDNFQRFRMGRASVNDLAIDQDRLLESQLLEVEGWSSAHISFVRLCHALGRYVYPDGSCRSEAPSL